MASSSRIILDSGAVSALAARHEGVRAYLARELRAGADVIIPSVVIAESTTGTARDNNLNRIMDREMIRDLDESLARAAGKLRYQRRRAQAGTIDAIIVATADEVPGSLIVTGDPDDLRPLAEERGVTRVVAL